MSLQTKIMATLSSLGANTVWPNAVPDDVALPFVVYQVLNTQPETTLDDSENIANYIVAFECYADDYASASALADSLIAAIRANAAANNLIYYRDVSPGDDYIALIDGYMEPVFIGFWD